MATTFPAPQDDFYPEGNTFYTDKKTLNVSGSSTHVVLEFPFEGGYFYLGSLVSISYSAYRDKSPVFLCGSPTVSGFAIGNRYVAGSMILNMFLEDEMSMFIESKLQDAYGRKKVKTMNDILHSYGKDDLLSFNISIIFTSEYHTDASAIRIYGASFVNNGQVMSIEDLVTEHTVSFVARSIKEQHNIKDGMITFEQTPPSLTGSAILRAKGR